MNANKLVDKVLSIAQYPMCTSVYNALCSRPGALVLSCGVFLNIPLLSNWHTTTQKWEHLVNYDIMKQNKKCRKCDYTLIQKVLVGFTISEPVLLKSLTGILKGLHPAVDTVPDYMCWNYPVGTFFKAKKWCTIFPWVFIFLKWTQQMEAGNGTYIIKWCHFRTKIDKYCFFTL